MGKCDGSATDSDAPEGCEKAATHGGPAPSSAGQLLVLGICLLDRPHHAAHVVAALQGAQDWQVTQRWAGLGRGAVPSELAPWLVLSREALVPKFVLLNQLLRDHRPVDYDYLLVVDDDITLPDRFVDGYLELVRRYDFALAQPARSANSFMNHRFVAQVPGIKGRRTRFVEIGPLFSVRRDLYATLLPFDESSPMGWGYDFAWPCQLESQELRMGIIDAFAVEHRLRGQARYYPYAPAARQMKRYFEQHEHLDEQQAFRVLEQYE